MNKFTSLLVVCFTSFLLTFDASSVNVALYRISEELNEPFSLISLFVTFYSLGAAVSIFPFALASDKNGKENVFLIGLCISSLGLLAVHSGSSPWFLLSARFLQGIGHGALIVSGIPIISAAFSQRKSLVLGIHGFFVGAGLALGPVISGFLMETYSWKVIFKVQFPIFIVLISVLFINGVRLKAHILYALNLKGISTVQILLKNFRFRYSAFIIFLTPFSVSFVFVLTPYILQDLIGLNVAHTGMYMALFPAMMSISSPICGKVSEFTGTSITAILGAILILAGESVAVFGLQSELIGIRNMSLMLLLLSGLGMGFVMVPTYAELLNSVKIENIGIASAVMAFCRILGFGLGPYAAAKSFGYLKNLGISELQSFSVCFALSILFVLASLGFLFLKKVISRRSYE